MKKGLFGAVAILLLDAGLAAAQSYAPYYPTYPAQSAAGYPQPQGYYQYQQAPAAYAQGYQQAPMYYQQPAMGYGQAYQQQPTYYQPQARYYGQAYPAQPAYGYRSSYTAPVVPAYSKSTPAQPTLPSRPTLVADGVPSSLSAKVVIKDSLPAPLPAGNPTELSTSNKPKREASRSTVTEVIDERGTCGADAAAPCDHCPAAKPAFADEGPAKCSPRVEIFAEGLYLKARGLDVQLGQPRDGFTALSAPRGDVGRVTPGYAPGGRAGADYSCTANSRIEGHVSWWESQDSHGITAPNGTFIQSYLTLPGIQSAAADSAAASGTLGLQLLSGDIAYTHLLCGIPECFAVHWLVGGRYAYLRENLDSTFTILGQTNVATHINFDGGGPRVGLEGEVFAKCGLSVYGRGTVDLLAGHWGATYSQNNAFAGNQGLTNFSSDRVVPVLELQLGVSWTSPKGHVLVRAGYEVDAWFNSVTTPGFIQSVQNSNFTTNGNNLRDTITFDGVVGHLEFRF